MKRNVGNLDRVIRMVLGIILLYLAFFQADILSSSTLYYFVVIFGIVNVVTAAFGMCPLYALAAISTYRPKN